MSFASLLSPFAAKNRHIPPFILPLQLGNQLPPLAALRASRKTWPSRSMNAFLCTSYFTCEYTPYDNAPSGHGISVEEGGDRMVTLCEKMNNLQSGQFT